jgi:hypothetical protein
MSFLVYHKLIYQKKIASVVEVNQAFVVVSKDAGIASAISESVKLVARMEANNLMPSMAELASVLASHSIVAVVIGCVLKLSKVFFFFIQMSFTQKKNGNELFNRK